MIGKKQITIDSQMLTAGLCTSDLISDGGIGTSSFNLNMLGTPGAMRATPVTTPTLNSGDTAISGGVIASTESPEVGNNTHNMRWFVDNDGQIFSADTTMGYKNQAPALSSTSAPNADMTVWGGDATYGYIYTSTGTNVAETRIVNASGDYTSQSSSWFSSLAGASSLVSGVPHPLLVFEKRLWVGDESTLRFAEDRTTLGGFTVTLNPTERIQCLGIDPGSGLMMIGVRSVSGNNDTSSSQSFIYLYDGFSPKPRRKIPVDGRIACFRNVGGQVFVMMDNTVGVWNGAGVTFLRRLMNISRSSADLPYKSHVTSFQNVLLVVDGQYVLAYGDIGNGKKVWWPFYKHDIEIDSIFFIGNYNDAAVVPIKPLIAVNSGSTLKYIMPTDITTVAAATYYSPFINFERPVNIRGIKVFTTGITTTTGIGGVSIIDDLNATTTPAAGTFVVPAAASPKYTFMFDFNKNLQALQVKLNMDTQAFAIIRAVIYYDPIE